MEIAERAKESRGGRTDERTILVGLRHNLWWVAAEADHRFGRDPGDSLREAAQARKEHGRPDSHFGFSLMLDAMDRERRGLDPGPALDEAEANMNKLCELTPIVRSTFFTRMIVGEIHLLRAGSLHRRKRDPNHSIKKAIAELKVATELDTKAAYPYYNLPRAHALAARVAISQGHDAGVAVRAALEAGRRGVAITSGNAQIQKAMAEAHVANGLYRASRGEDPRPALESAGKALDAADAVNPRDYQAFLLRAEVHLEGARYELSLAGNPEPCLRRCESAIRKGLAIKGNEPSFRTLLARMAALTRTEAGASL